MVNNLYDAILGTSRSMAITRVNTQIKRPDINN
jgi:hypothetical protein